MEPTLDKKTSRRKGVGRKRLLALSFTLVLASISSSYFLRRRFRREYEAFVSYGNDLKHIWTAVVLIFFVLLIKKKQYGKRSCYSLCVFPTERKFRHLFPFGVFVFETKRAKANSNIPRTFPFLSKQAISKDKTFG